MNTRFFPPGGGQSFLDKPVPHAAHRVEITRRRAELFPQPPHVRVHRPRVNQVVVLPHVLQQLLAGLHPARAAAPAPSAA